MKGGNNMKKLLVILIAFAMLATAIPAVLGTSYGQGQTRSDCFESLPITTKVTVVGCSGDDDDDSGAGGDDDDDSTGAVAPFIKHKWELVECIDMGPDLMYQVDDDPDHEYLAVAVNPYLTRIVHYYVLVEEKTYNLDRAYVDVWHPDGSFKYQIALEKLCLLEGIDAWNHVTCNYPEVITSQTDETYPQTLDELQQEEAFLYHGWAELSYCQPAGWYTVCARAVDSHGMWSVPLWNWFWYIPTASICLDFDNISYGVVGEEEWKWTGGDDCFDWGDGKPTVRNAGNVPLEFRFKQDDMNFGKTLVDGILYWNVKFDARLGNAVDGCSVEYYPDEYSGWVSELEMCTEEKLDFSIHIYKGVPGQTYVGNLWIYASTYQAFYGQGPYPTSDNCPDVGQKWYNGVAPDGVPAPSSFEPII